MKHPLWNSFALAAGLAFAGTVAAQSAVAAYPVKPVRVSIGTRMVAAVRFTLEKSN